MPWADDVDAVEVAGLDLAVHVGVDQVEARGGAPVAQETRLDVPGLKRPAHQRVVQQVDLADAQIVGRPPVRVYQVQLFGAERSLHRDVSHGVSPSSWICDLGSAAHPGPAVWQVPS